MIHTVMSVAIVSVTISKHGYTYYQTRAYHSDTSDTQPNQACQLITGIFMMMVSLPFFLCLFYMWKKVV